MTTQAADRMKDQGEEFRVKPFPLSQLGDSWCTVIREGERKPRFWRNSTNNHKAYFANWEIEDDKLYLTNFKACGEEWCELSMQDVFGTSRLFAFWFTGELFSNVGARIYGMFEPVFERNHVWRFEHGVVKERYLRNNDTPELRAKAEQFNKWMDAM